MILEVIVIYKIGGKQVYVDVKRDGRLYNKLKVSDFISYIYQNKDVTCANFIVVNKTYLKGKNCSLRMEVLDNEQTRLGSNPRVRGNREGFRGTERRVTTEGEKRNIEYSGERGHSVKCSKGQHKQEFIHDVDSNGIVILNSCSPSEFKANFDKYHFSTDYGWCVDGHDNIEDYSDKQLFYSNNHGFLSVDSNGNIGSVLKVPNSEKGFAKIAIINALRHNGDRLDCFAINNGGLVDMYMKCGFIPVCRLKFNTEYAPEGWKPDMEKPDIVVMMHNLDTADEVCKKYGTYGNYKDYLSTHNIPYFDDYDEALEYRDNELEKLKQKKYRKNAKGGLNLLKSAFSKSK